MERQVQYIYMITNPKGRIYIGKTNNLLKRTQGYSGLWGCKNQPGLLGSIKKHGWFNHHMQIIWSGKASDNQAYRLEKFFIKKYDSFHNGLNAHGGGKGTGSGENHPWWGRKHSQETKDKIGKITAASHAKGLHKVTDIHRRRLCNASIRLWNKVRSMGCGSYEHGIHPLTKYKLLQKTGINHWDTYCKIYNLGT